MANEHVIEWEDWMLSQVCAERSFPAIRPAAPEPSDPSFSRVDVSALIEAMRAKSLLTEECEMSVIEDFKKQLGIMSHSSAGWDFQLPPAQRAEENRQEQAALKRAREIWGGNPSLHDDLRRAFAEYGPLATISEIESAGNV